MATATTTLAQQDVTAIRATRDPWCQACVDRDWDGLLALCTKDVVFLPPDAPVAEGRAATRSYLETYPEMKTFTFNFTHIEGSGDLASARGNFAITANVDDNEVAFTGKFVDTFRKASDGSWKYSSVIWNHDHALG